MSVHDYTAHAADALKYWGYTAGDGLTGVARTQFQSFVHVMNKTGEAEFLRKEMSPWEEILFGDGSVAMAVRESLMLSMTVHGCEEQEQRWIESRYLQGEFDSVLTHYLVIGRVFAYSVTAISGKATRGQFDFFPGLMDEVDVVTPTSSLGRRNISKAEWAGFKGEVLGPKAILAYRDKLPGSRLVKVARGERAYLVGYKDIEVPLDFPVEAVEAFAGKLYVLYPYMQFEPFKYAGHEFVPHPWSSCKDYVPSKWSEGVMIMTPMGEYRAKYSPSEEVRYEGDVWEVIYGIRYGSATQGLVLVRPRTGKVPVAPDAAQKQILSVMDARSVLQERTKRVFSYRTSGPYSVTLSEVEGGVVWDSGYRQERSCIPYRAQEGQVTNLNVQVQEIRRTLPKSERTVQTHSVAVAPPVDPSVTIMGSKLLIVSRSTDSIVSAIHLFKERSDKMFDFIGGTSEVGETRDQTLMREVQEELRIVLDMTYVTYLGVSKGGDALAHMYVVDRDALPGKFGVHLPHKVVALTTADWTSKLGDAAPHVFRIISHSLALCGSMMGLWWVAASKGRLRTEKCMVELSDTPLVVEAKQLYMRRLEEAGQSATSVSMYKTVTLPLVIPPAVFTSIPSIARTSPFQGWRVPGVIPPSEVRVLAAGRTLIDRGKEFDDPERLYAAVACIIATGMDPLTASVVKQLVQICDLTKQELNRRLQSLVTAGWLARIGDAHGYARFRVAHPLSLLRN